MTEVKLEKYPAYKDSGVEWLGEIPEHWEILPGLRFIFENKDRNKGMIRNTVLSLSYGNIRVRGEDELTGLVPESFETYQFVNKGDLIFRPTDLQNDTVSLRSSISEYEGIITNAYLNLRFTSKANSKFYHYFFRAIDNNKVIYGLGSGLRQNISYLDFRRFLFPFPPLTEQAAIANFLDNKTALIDKSIALKEKQIELLKERRQILIHRAVTRGLNPDVKLKDSGVQWIGEIPEGWEVKRLKYFVDIQGGFAFNSTDFKDEGVQIIKIANTYMNELCLDRQPTFVDYSFLVSHSQWVISKGDILISLTGTLGKKDYGFAILIDNDEKFLLNQRVAKISVKENVEAEYILHILQSEMYLNQLYMLPAGTKQANLSNNNILNIKVAYPNDTNERQQILRYITSMKFKISTVISLKEKEIEKLKEYKSVLINEAVSGKIKVN
nr:restriction endonuclease subunit S [uncultured Bacteroides sp.]